MSSSTYRAFAYVAVVSAIETLRRLEAEAVVELAFEFLVWRHLLQ